MLNLIHHGLPSPCLMLVLAISSLHPPFFASAAAIALPNSTLPDSANPAEIPPVCTVDWRWAAPGVSKADCIATVDKLYDIEVKNAMDKDEDFEFLNSIKMASTPGFEPRVTPRKYTVGTCTLAVVMLRFFKDKGVTLPVEEGYTSYRDIASFTELWEAGDRIRKGCVDGSGMPGMATEGGRDAIGVFMWATDSPQNRLVPGVDTQTGWSPSGSGVLMLGNVTVSGMAFSNGTAVLSPSR